MRLLVLLCAIFLRDVHAQGCRRPNLESIPNAIYSPPNLQFNINDRITLSCEDDIDITGPSTAVCVGGRWRLQSRGTPSCGGQGVVPTQAPVPVIPRSQCPRCPDEGDCTLHNGRPACICPDGYFRIDRECIARTVLTDFPSCTLCASIPDATCHLWGQRPVCICNPSHFRYFQRSSGGGGLFRGRAVTAVCVARPIDTTVCSRPVLNSNVIILGSSPTRSTWSLGDRVAYGCAGDYVIRGRRSAVCTRNGEFSSTGVSCVRAPPPRSTQATVTTQSPPSTRNFCIYQNIPAAPTNGRIVNVQNRLYNVGETVNYDCLPGFELGGDRQTVCENSGFRRVNNFCAAITRTQPPIINTRPPVQTTLPPAPSSGCIIPIAPVNGRIMPPSRPVWLPGNTVTYSCLQGYFLRGVAVATCMATGRFTSLPPTCIRAGVCEQPVVPFRGRIERLEQSVWNIGDQARYSCNEGYMLVGEAVLTCLASLQYNAPFPLCINSNPTAPVQTVAPPRITQRPLAICSNPPIPQFAVLEEVGRTTWVENQILRFRCLPDYTLVVGTPAICQSNGLFSDVSSLCVPQGCREGPIVPSNGFIATSLSPPFTVGTQLAFSCQSGYSLSGATFTTCLSTGSFENVISNCLAAATTSPPAQQCFLNPQPPANGFVNPADSAPYADRAVVNFGCNSGYSLIGDPSTTCVNGAFTLSFPFCSQIATTPPTTIPTGPTCQRPEPPIFGEILEREQQVWEFNQAINYNCFDGFSLRPEEETAFCGVNGFPPAPVCLPIPVQNCASPPSPMFGTNENEQNLWSIGDIARFKCRDGFVLSDPLAFVVCVAVPGQTLGRYEGTIPTCDVVGGSDDICTAAAPANGILVSIDTRYSLGEIVRYACALGYTLDGSASRICQSNGQLSGEDVTCIASSMICNPQAVPNGRLIPNANGIWRTNDVILHECVEGYIIAPNTLPTQFCRENGNILGEGPECIPDIS